LRQGSAAWNEWRARTGFIRPDLSGADLGRANLDRADLSFGDLTGANLNEASLRDANLLHADLSGAHLIEAKILHSNLINAKLQFATLIGARLSDADLSGAFLHWADLSGAVLAGANLSGANLVRANFRRAVLAGANLSDAELSGTIFGDVDLAKTIGLGNCKHDGPSIIDFLTLSRSSNVPISFLRGCGLPDNLIEYLPSLLDEAIRFYSNGAGYIIGLGFHGCDHIGIRRSGYGCRADSRQIAFMAQQNRATRLAYLDRSLATRAVAGPMGSPSASHRRRHPSWDRRWSFPA
jgi:uncharacterized protein YjbI with pentapeptide repeats